MKVKAILPLNNRTTMKHCFETEEGVKRGDIVVVQYRGKETYGIVSDTENIHSNQASVGRIDRKVSDLDKVFFWLDFEKKLLSTNVKLGQEAFNQYIQTRGNTDTPIEVAKLKMKRNLLLAHKPSSLFISHNGLIGLNYGSMQLLYGNDTIYYIKNKCKIPKGWTKSETAYTYFSKLLGIEGK